MFEGFISVVVMLFTTFLAPTLFVVKLLLSIFMPPRMPEVLDDDYFNL